MKDQLCPLNHMVKDTCPICEALGKARADGANDERERILNALVATEEKPSRKGAKYSQYRCTSKHNGIRCVRSGRHPGNHKYTDTASVEGLSTVRSA